MEGVILCVVVGAVVGLCIRRLFKPIVKETDPVLGVESIKELSGKLVTLKRNANMRSPFKSPPEKVPPELTESTSQGTKFSYIVVAVDDKFEHRLTVSRAGQPISHHSAITLATWIAYFLDVPCSKVSVPIQFGSGATHFVEFDMLAEEQHDYERKPVNDFSKKSMPSYLTGTIRDRRQVVEKNSFHTTETSQEQPT